MASISKICLALLWCASAFAKPLTDGVSSSLNVGVKSGEWEASAQENLVPYSALSLGFRREFYDELSYYGWALGSDWRLAQWLTHDGRALLIGGVGLTGLQGEGHGHFAWWARASAEWESRRVMVGASAERQRGAAMPGIDEGQVRFGYALTAPKMDGVQPWLVANFLSRSGTGAAQWQALVRLLAANWWLEAGFAVNSGFPTIGAAIAL